MNKPLLRKIAKLILEKPRKYNQNEGCCRGAFCIGGHALALTNPKLYKEMVNEHEEKSAYLWDEWNDRVREALGLTCSQLSKLCGHFQDWPHKFATAYREARTAKERAKVGYDRIMCFINTGK